VEVPSMRSVIEHMPAPYGPPLTVEAAENRWQ